MGVLQSHLVLLFVFAVASPTTLSDKDYGGIPLWINRLLGEPSVLSLEGRLDQAWYRANNPQACPRQCDCPIQWPTALYCDHRSLAAVPGFLPATTQYLFLQGNNISSLSSPHLANITGLRWLILDHNRLRSDQLDWGFLQNQTLLNYFFANRNQLSSVPSGLPDGLKQLRLAHNKISSIAPGLLGLHLLDLGGNSFSVVPKHLPPLVQQLYLSNNSLSGVHKDSLVGLVNLRHLGLSHCGLQSPHIHPEAFNLSSLLELDLSYNELVSIPTVPTTLQHFYLEANDIRELNLTSFCREVGPPSYSRLKTLRLDGNRMSYRELPSDWVYCLRVIESIHI
ncbi:lumican isoform X3 [Entelurus aequoreus]|uniref:lumican isoform X3 n=1 Tax=Entelurus aequoreus TaxID=161455 RepID=UPI002B1CEEAD|nr:lumican isoform X3 [Entelurus aequoreus]